MKFTIEQFTKPTIPELSIPENIRGLLLPKIESKLEASTEPIGNFLQEGVVAKDTWVGFNQLADDGVRYLYINIKNWPIEYVSQLIEAINRGLPTAEARVALLEKLRPQLPLGASSIIVDIFPSVARPRVSKSMEVPKSFLAIRTKFEQDFSRRSMYFQVADQEVLDALLAQPTDDDGTEEGTVFGGGILHPKNEKRLTIAKHAEKLIVTLLENLVEQFVTEGYGKTDTETLDQIFNNQIDLAIEKGKINNSTAMMLIRKFYLTLSNKMRKNKL